MNCHFSPFAALIAGILFIVFEGLVRIDGIEVSEVSNSKSLNRAWGHSPAFIPGETFGSVVPIESLRGVGGGGRGGRRRGGINGGFRTPRRKQPRVFSSNNKSALKSPFVNLRLLVLLLLFSIFFNNTS